VKHPQPHATTTLIIGVKEFGQRLLLASNLG